MWSNPSHISSPLNLSILVIFIIGYCILPSLFIPQIDSYLSLIQGGWLSDGSCCGLDAAADSEQTDPGHVGIGLGLLQMVCCISFFLFPFLRTCFHSTRVITMVCKWGHTSICNKYPNRGSQRHKLDFVATRWQDVIPKFNHICVSQGT